MPTGTQGTVEVVRKDTSLSKSDTAVLKSCFPASPVGVEEPLTIAANRLESKLHQYYQTNVLDGDVENGLFGSTVHMDYSKNGAPDWGDVPTGAAGLPASAWTPNPVSPGPGSINPEDKAAAPADYGTTATDSSYGVFATGVGASPSEASKKQSTSKLGDYMSGKSAGSR